MEVVASQLEASEQIYVRSCKCKALGDHLQGQPERRCFTSVRNVSLSELTRINLSDIYTLESRGVFTKSCGNYLLPYI